MKTIYSAFVTLICFACLAGALPIEAAADTSGAAAAPVTIPAGTAIPLKLVDDIRSGHANAKQVGEKVHFAVSQDVMGSNGILVPRNTVAIGEITQNSSAGDCGRAGRLAFKFDALEMPDGTQVPLQADEITVHGSSVSPLLILLSPLGFVLANGGNAAVHPGKDYTAHVASDTPVSLSATAPGAQVGPAIAATTPSALPTGSVTIDPSVIGSDTEVLVTLNNGNVYFGKVVTADANSYTLSTIDGQVVVPASDIKSVQYQHR